MAAAPRSTVCGLKKAANSASTPADITAGTSQIERQLCSVWSALVMLYMSTTQPAM